jgi:hypothetical protein
MPPLDAVLAGEPVVDLPRFPLEAVPALPRNFDNAEPAVAGAFEAALVLRKAGAGSPIFRCASFELQQINSKAAGAAESYAIHRLIAKHEKSTIRGAGPHCAVASRRRRLYRSSTARARISSAGSRPSRRPMTR